MLRSAFDNATHFSVPEFATMLRYCVYDRDPRRFYALADLALAPVSFATDDGVLLQTRPHGPHPSLTLPYHAPATARYIHTLQ